MIVRDEDKAFLLITQPDHAQLAEVIAAAMRTEAPLVGPHRDAILLATREHDNGWIEVDAEAVIEPATGRPFAACGLAMCSRCSSAMAGRSRQKHVVIARPSMARPAHRPRSVRGRDSTVEGAWTSHCCPGVRRRRRPARSDCRKYAMRRKWSGHRADVTALLNLLRFRGFSF